MPSKYPGHGTDAHPPVQTVPGRGTRQRRTDVPVHRGISGLAQRLASENWYSRRNGPSRCRGVISESRRSRSDRRDSSDCSGRTGARSQPNTRPRTCRTPYSAFAMGSAPRPTRARGCQPRGARPRRPGDRRPRRRTRGRRAAAHAREASGSGTRRGPPAWRDGSAPRRRDVREHGMELRHHRGAFADRPAHSLRGPGADIPDREHARDT